MRTLNGKPLLRAAAATFLAAALLASVHEPAFSQRAAIESDAFIAPTVADTAGVLLIIPQTSQTIRIKQITVWYDNAANTNAVHAGIVRATAAHTRELWLGEAMTSAGIKTVVFPDLNRTITASVAQAGIRLFISATASDSLSAIVTYQVIPEP